ncbi:MAG: ribosome silencing factor [Deltaproteobacteria bacterium]|nr:MAG: ribosome silencing factor [Deltaproteobacteria bacterium]
MLELAVQTIDSVKGLDPVAMEVKGLCSFADYFLICSGTSRRHVLALAEHLEEALGQAGVKPLGVEGLQEGLWVLMDYNDVVIHIFSESHREFYNLEGLWAEAPRLFMETGPGVSPGPAAAGSGKETDPTRHE